LTKNGEPFVALIDTRKLDYYHALKVEHRQPLVLGDIAKGFEDVLSGRVRSEIQFRESVEVLTLRTAFVRITKAYGGFDGNRTQATVPPGHVTRDWRERDASSDYTKSACRHDQRQLALDIEGSNEAQCFAA
jgi:hypothetical protein